MASAFSTLLNKVCCCARAIYEGRASMRGVRLTAGQRGRLMEIWRSGSLPFQSNARTNWVEEREANEGHCPFREAELARSQFCRIDGTKTRQRSGYPPTRSRGRKHGGLSVRLLWGRAITQYSWLQSVKPADVIRPGERSIEGFNDLHATSAARARWWLVIGAAWVVVIIVVVIHRRRGHIEQASAKCKLVGAMSVGKEAVAANAMEAIRQHMEEEAANELGDRDSHDFALVIAAFPIVLPAEGDVGLVEIEQATVGDRNAMGVAREIGQDLLGTGAGLLGIDNPFGCAQGRESGGKCLRLVETDEIRKELQFTGIECCRQTFEEQAPEQGREHVRKKGPRLARNPTLAIRRDAATRNDAVRMRMVLEVLAPCVQDGSDADVGTEVLAIG